MTGAAAAPASDPAAEQPPQPDVRLRVEHLSVVTKDAGVPVVEDVTLTVHAGEVVGLVGESGCGKTTLGLAMLAYTRRGLRVAAGSVVLDGTDLLGLSTRQLRQLRGSRLAYVPQDPGTALNPTRRIGPQVREALSYHDYSAQEIDERITELLVEVGLDSVPGVLDAYPHQLSGGQQQRAAIAMAFACRPSLIVLDEPTTGLDVTTQRTVLRTIADLCSRYGVAAVYVSHDVAVVGELAGRVAVMYAGRIVEVGDVADVFAHPTHPYTQGLLRAIPSPDRAEQLVGMEGVPPRPGARPPGCSFAPRCPFAEARCVEKVPEPVRATGEHHLVRCVLAGEARQPSPRPPVVTTSRDAASPDLPPLLAVDHLNASYGSFQALHDVSLNVARGDCLAVVGESGSGKTTLARCVAGLHTAWTGSIEVDGRALPPGIRTRQAHDLQELQYIFQNPYASLNPRRSIGALVAQPVDHFSEASRHERDAAVMAALNAVSLPADIGGLYPDQLSGGERQRVALARAIAVGPSLLICDEVTSALDVSVQALVVEMLRNLQREHSLALLFITHNLALVRSIAQRVLVMRDGRVVEEGTVSDVLDRPREDYTRRLLADVPRHDRAVPSG